MISSNGSFVYYGNSTTDTVFKLPQKPPVLFRYIIIRRFTTSYLTICEVELFEAGMHNSNTEGILIDMLCFAYNIKMYFTN
jgi:hypothetical protein